MDERIKNIPGWLSENDSAILQKYTQLAPDLIIEIGTYCGRSALVIGQGIEESNYTPKFYAVDPHYHTTLTRFSTADMLLCYSALATIPDYGQHVRRLVIESEKAACLFDNNTIDMIFVDGNHTYDFVVKDITHWLKKLKPTGYMIFHDHNLVSVKKAIDLFCEDLVCVEDGFTAVYKRAIQ